MSIRNLTSVDLGAESGRVMLDVGCGIDVLLRRLLERLPLLEAEGVAASANMLQQAQATLRAWSAGRSAVCARHL